MGSRSTPDRWVVLENFEDSAEKFNHPETTSDPERHNVRKLDLFNLTSNRTRDELGIIPCLSRVYPVLSS